MSETITMARPYAKGIFELALKDQSLAQWSEQLKRLAGIVQQPALQQILFDPRLSKNELAQLLMNISGSALNEKARNLLQVLAVNRRFAFLPEIEMIFAEYRDRYERIIEIKVTSAQELTKQQQQELQSALTRRFQEKTQLIFKIDPQLISGAIIRVGDEVIDNSILGKLERMQEALLA